MPIETNLTPERRQAMIALGAWNDMLLTDYLDEAVASAAGRPAIVTYRMAEGSHDSLSYAELNEKVTRMAAGLAGLGVAKGDVVSCQLPNWWQMTALHLACIRIGAVLNPLMPIFREHELRFMLAQAESKVFVVPGVFRGFDHAAMARGLKAELTALEQVLVVGGEGVDSFETVLLERAWERETDTAALFRERRPGGDDVVQLLYTSGTTGKPKGVMHTSNTLMSHIRPFATRLGLGNDDTVFMPSPLAHQLGFLYGLMLPVYLQATAVLQDTWKPAEAVDIIRAERPSLMLGSTPFLADIAEQAEAHGPDLQSLKLFMCAGAPIPSPLVEKAARNLPTRIISAWGMTENGAVTTTRPGDAPSRAVHTDGLPLPFMELKVTDLEGNTLPPGQEGPLYVRGASLFVGYFKQPELYGVDAEGWFPTGDLARLDEQGYVRITGRSKDVVIRGGENIPIVDIENALYQHPAIQAVALVGRPDERLGERLCAYVTLKEGVESLTLTDVTAFLSERQVTRQYQPEFLVVLDELPRTPSGKIQKFKLREQAAQGVA
ncbi:AMP-binding protein [Halomonas daqingensis]|uniref:AMP-binding protein n=1 Tax=Billgrantia desiderata TaxID=52021 RepID=A0ABS9BAL1_9GAMM|nr:AMP-binding protein [Halomonas desiderata]MCE8031093.1 AMP-binding protein [Halomonas desiderata]MCE8044705.1 AMP-binding protein [Halomonas desiderata]MCE8049279.1 AMP-binding protein [Halomonas desiderata]